MWARRIINNGPSIDFIGPSADFLWLLSTLQREKATFHDVFGGRESTDLRTHVTHEEAFI